MNQNHLFRRHQIHLPHFLTHFGRARPLVRAFTLVIALATVFVVAAVFHSRFERWFPAFQFGIPSSQLLLYTGYTVLRLAIAYGISLLLALLGALLVTRFKWCEAWLMPVFDILQSVPALAFFPVAVLAFAHLGFVEGSALFILITGMLWALLFNIVAAIHAIPSEVQQAARVFGAKGFKYYRYVILPAIFPAVVTGSILSFGAGWNIIIVAEYINFGADKIILPGIGSLLDEATYGTVRNTELFAAALATMIGTIIILNRMVWHRLLMKSERYKFD